ncbi:MAG TPA: hypothetical protein VID76_00075 [Solirubrobacterales bacterium]
MPLSVGRSFACNWDYLSIARRKKERGGAEPAPTHDYTDPEGNVLTLRGELSGGTVRKLSRPDKRPGASAEDVYLRRSEMLFERLAVSWEIAGLPLDDQKMLLGRYRMADAETQRWVRRTITEHLERHIPELAE